MKIQVVLKLIYLIYHLELVPFVWCSTFNLFPLVLGIYNDLILSGCIFGQIPFGIPLMRSFPFLLFSEFLVSNLRHMVFYSFLTIPQQAFLTVLRANEKKVNLSFQESLSFKAKWKKKGYHLFSNSLSTVWCKNKNRVLKKKDIKRKG